MTHASPDSPATPIASRRVALQSVATDVAFGLDAIPVRSRPLPEAAVAAVPRAPASPASPALRTPTPVADEASWSSAPARTAEAEEPLLLRPSALAALAPIPTLAARADVRGIASETDRATALTSLEATHAATCPHCTTATAHTRLVFGEGSAVARLMFIGEAPGETEDQLGRPFVGRAGQKLDEMIRAMGLRREDVYIANVLKSRPPENRTPLQHEVDRCGPYLIEQIRIIRPAAIVTLGGPATKLVLATEQGITRLRGVWGEILVPLEGPGADAAESIAIPVMPTFHPAYLLRNYTAETRRQVWHDLQAVLAKLRDAS